MSFDPFDKLPEHIKESIKEMMKKLQEIDPEQIEEMINQVFGDDFMEKLREFTLPGGVFTFPLDPSMVENFETMLNNIMGQGVPFSQPFTMENEEEPYFEVIPEDDDHGEVIVEMPGITDLRQIRWTRTVDGIELEADGGDVKYKTKIPLSSEYKLKDALASIKNSVFVLPYKRD